MFGMFWHLYMYSCHVLVPCEISTKMYKKVGNARQLYVITTKGK